MAEGPAPPPPPPPPPPLAPLPRDASRRAPSAAAGGAARDLDIPVEWEPDDELQITDARLDELVEEAWVEGQEAEAAALPPGGDDDDDASPLLGPLLELQITDARLNEHPEQEEAWREAQDEAEAAATVPPRGGYDDDASPLVSLLLLLLSELPDVFAAEVLTRLDPIDRTFLAQVGGACRAAVAASDLPCAGTRGEVLGRSVWVVTHHLKDFCTTVERLLWAKANGCPRDTPHTCMYAAAGGHLQVLQLAREHHCPWDGGTYSSAANGGHLEVVQWARAHGCPDWPWNWPTLINAASAGHHEVFLWALRHGCGKRAHDDDDRIAESLNTCARAHDWPYIPWDQYSDSVPETVSDGEEEGEYEEYEEYEEEEEKEEAW